VKISKREWAELNALDNGKKRGMAPNSFLRGRKGSATEARVYAGQLKNRIAAHGGCRELHRVGNTRRYAESRGERKSSKTDREPPLNPTGSKSQGIGKN